MTKVQRYTSTYIAVDAGGEWVRYADYEKLVAENQRLRELVGRMEDAVETLEAEVRRQDSELRRQWDGVLRRREVAAMLGVSRTTLWRMVSRKEMPPPIELSRGRIGWRAQTLRRWLDRKETEADIGWLEETDDD